MSTLYTIGRLISTGPPLLSSIGIMIINVALNVKNKLCFNIETVTYACVSMLYVMGNLSRTGPPAPPSTGIIVSNTPLDIQKT